MKEAWHGKLTFMGGIDTCLMSCPDPRPLEQEIRSKLSVAKRGGGYIYHCDHSIPKNVSFQQYLRVLALVRQHGRFDGAKSRAS